MKRYPLKLESVNHDILWGGTILSEQYGKPAGKIAEAWELTVHPQGINRILNGEYQGMLLSEYLGSDADFPLMFKLIDACDRLSVQVHPVKTEMWYIVDCKEGATLVYGLQDAFDEASFREALEAGSVESLLRTVPVHKGDVFFIPQGLVHAIGAGILIAEIQENSNVTYRVYDYGRLQNGKPRELHVDAAMETVRDFTDTEIDARRYACGRGDDHDCRSSNVCSDRGGAVLAHSFHPAFRQLVEGELAREDLEAQLQELLRGETTNAACGETLDAACEETSSSETKKDACPRQNDRRSHTHVIFAACGESFSNMIGHKACNKQYFSGKYPNVSIRFTVDNTLPRGSYQIKL